MSTAPSLLLAELRAGYCAARFTPADIIAQVMARADRAPERHVWITRLSPAQVKPYVDALAGRRIEDLPLYGIPFVIKDNIDLAGVPTTAGCPDFARVPAHSAPVVQRLLDAGAVPLGKTNMDQFATGLVGTRSPYGACRNSFNADMIAGGSSSGSAVAVATGLASFALGTDTAGSGRVPAAFNNLLGLKPSLGALSTRGVVPACRSLDCVSIFAFTADDAGRVLDAAAGFDAADPYSRQLAVRPLTGRRFGVPPPEQLQFFGDTEYARLFEAAVARLEASGAVRVAIDFEPFLEAARLLYEGPWLAERFAAVGKFMEAHPGAVLPVTAQIIAAGRHASAVQAFEAAYQLQHLRRASEAAWACADFLLTPTAGTLYSIAAVEAEPLRLNATLGRYTNFMNLFDLAGVAVPAGFRADGLPFGVTLIGPAHTERGLLQEADGLQRAAVSTVGATSWSVPAKAAAISLRTGFATLAVCGAHMEGLPLNRELRERGGYFIERARTASAYRLFALSNAAQPGAPARPGLVRVAAGGAPIELEIWALPDAQVGAFAAGIPSPLGLGTVALEDGRATLGFLCEAYATEGATEITRYGGWRAYLRDA